MTYVEQQVGAFQVGRIDDYQRLVESFGATPMTDELVRRFEQVTGRKAHRFLRRGLAISHRDLDLILNLKEQGKPFYMYTGRGASSGSLHLGHIVPLELTRFLQEALDAPLVFQMTDDEKFIFKQEMNQEEARRMALANIRDIVALGFDPEKTFIFLNTEYIQRLYPTACRIQKMLSMHHMKSIFGFKDDDSVGKYAFPAIEAAPCDSACFPDLFKHLNQGAPIACCVVSAIDQDPFFRMTRDVAPRLGIPKPAVVHTRFLPSLQGVDTKMSSSASKQQFLIFLNDTPSQVKKKINSFAFSGGRDTKEEHELLGGRCEVDVAFHYLEYFLEDDDELASIRDAYTSGKLLTGQLKARTIAVVQAILRNHQQARETIDEAGVQRFMQPKSM